MSIQRKFIIFVLTLVMLANFIPAVALASGTSPTVSAGMGSSGVIINGSLWNWGKNEFGQLGDGTTTNQYAPVLVKNSDGSQFSNIKAVSVSGYFTIALKNDGTVWSFGENTSGQLGDRSTTNRTHPVQVKNANGSLLTKVTAVSSGLSHSVALKSDGTVWCWGSNSVGQLGNGTTTNSSYPVQVKNSNGSNFTGAIAVAAGSQHTVILKNDGTVWAFGLNSRGQLGNGQITDQVFPVPVPNPVQVKKWDGTFLTNITAIAAGYLHTVALRDDGAVLAWGWNGDGQCGNGFTDRTTAFTVHMPGGSNFTSAKAIAAGNMHTMVLKQDGTVWAWGDNYYYQLTDGTIIDKYEPVQLKHADGSYITNVTGIAAGMDHNIIVKGDGTVWTWGWNDFGELGKGSYYSSQYPVNISFSQQVAAPTFSSSSGTYANTRNVTISCATSGATIYYTKDGSTPTTSSTVYTAPIAVTSATTLKAIAVRSGFNNSSVSTATYSFRVGTPAFSPSAGTYTSAQSVTISSATTGARIYYTKDGTTPTTASTLYSGPIAVSATTTLKAIAVRSSFTNSYVGTAKYTIQNSVSTPTFSPAAGTYTTAQSVTISCATNSATIYYTLDGSTPTTASAIYSAPITVSATTTLKAIAVRSGYTTSAVASATFSIKQVPQVAANLGSAYVVNGGKVWAWGNNQYGQLGNGTTVNSLTPVQVKNSDGTLFSNVKAIALGYYHVIAVKNDGTVWTWGYNMHGELGNMANYNSSYPVQVKNNDGTVLNNVETVAAGGYHTLAIKKDGTVWTWGYNVRGQLGIGTTTDTWYPVQAKNADGTFLGNVKSIQAGWAHNIVLKNDGTVWAWGDNVYGELGLGISSTNGLFPTQVKTAAGLGLSDVKAIASGDTYAFALKSDGTVWAWGSNSSGQLGTGTANNYYAAQTKNSDGSNLTGVTAVTAGINHTLALKTDGTLWAWGSNVYGALGNGTTTNSSFPILVKNSNGTNLTGTIVFDAGYHSLAIKTDGTLWAWGLNSSGQLGNSTTTNSLYPVQTLNSSGAPFVITY